MRAHHNFVVYLLLMDGEAAWAPSCGDQSSNSCGRMCVSVMCGLGGLQADAQGVEEVGHKIAPFLIL